MVETWPDIAGRVQGADHVLPIRVYYEDTDFSGAVYHANYLKFCERARSDYLRLLGIHHHELQGTAGFMVRRMLCDFLRPANIDQLLEVTTHMQAATGARLVLAQSIRHAGLLLFTAEVTVAFVDGAGKPRRLPAALLQALQGAV